MQNGSLGACKNRSLGCFRSEKDAEMSTFFDRALLILSVAPTLSAIVQCKFMAVLLAGRLRSALGVGTTGPAKDRLKALRSSA